MSTAALTPEAAFAEMWAASASINPGDLGGDSPDLSNFVGDVPLLKPDDVTELPPAFATLVGATVQRTRQTNDGLVIVEAVWTLEIHALALATAERIAAGVVATFNRQSATYEGGTIYRFRYQGFSRRQGQDGLWVIAQSWSVMYEQ